MCLGVENEEHESNKNALPCLLDTLSVFLFLFSIIISQPKYTTKTLIRYQEDMVRHFCSIYVLYFLLLNASADSHANPSLTRCSIKHTLGYLWYLLHKNRRH